MLFLRQLQNCENCVCCLSPCVCGISGQAASANYAKAEVTITHDTRLPPVLAVRGLCHGCLCVCGGVGGEGAHILTHLPSRATKKEDLSWGGLVDGTPGRQNWERRDLPPAVEIS